MAVNLAGRSTNRCQRFPSATERFAIQRLNLFKWPVPSTDTQERGEQRERSRMCGGPAPGSLSRQAGAKRSVNTKREHQINPGRKGNYPKWPRKHGTPGTTSLSRTPETHPGNAVRRGHFQCYTNGALPRGRTEVSANPSDGLRKSPRSIHPHCLITQRLPLSRFANPLPKKDLPEGRTASVI